MLNDFTTEEWRSVPDWPYEVSNLGQVRRVPNGRRRPSGRALKPGIQRGYEKVVLSDEPRRRTYSVHQLVARAFIGPPPTPKHQINHLDGHKDNNRVQNLEWVTLSQNVLHAFRTGLKEPMRGSRHGVAKLTEENVAVIRRLKGKGLSGAKVAAWFGVHMQLVYLIWWGRIWKHVA